MHYNCDYLNISRMIIIIIIIIEDGVKCRILFDVSSKKPSLLVNVGWWLSNRLFLLHSHNREI